VEQLRAVVLDVDGTLSDTERDGHRPAFNAAFAAHGLPFAWDVEEYGGLLGVTGGRRRLAGYLRARGCPEPDELAARVHATKTRLFVERIRAGECAARPGVRELVADLAGAGIAVGIATTGSRAWVAPLVDRLLGPGAVGALVTGEDVARLKPEPDAYLLALRLLGVGAAGAVAVEDSAVGLRAARAAGLATIVVTNGYTADQDLSGATLVRAAFDDPQLTAADCRAVLAAG
jgi:HAD superfamily hydrolase (TIGR01509 family)